jgi:hypothetical protein
MNWTDDPATEQQLTYLRQYGYVPDHALTRTEAAALIRNYKHPAAPRGDAGATDDSTLHEAYRLRLEVDSAQRALASAQAANSETDSCQGELAKALNRRQVFWLDTCRETREMAHVSVQVLDLYQRYGCRFFPPTHAQAQEILDALDAAMLVWDRDHPELFYQTLELNFPQAVKLSK